MNLLWRLFTGALITGLLHLSALAQAKEQTSLSPNSGGTACLLKPEQLQSFLSLSSNDFDEDLHGGFREFAHQGCELQAAMLTDSYVVSAPNRMNEIGRGGLLFHASQLYAYSGLNRLASQRFLQALDLHEQQNADLAWNTYVLASIAFLKNDRAELLHQHDLVAHSKETPGNKMNFEVVNRFVACFGKLYDQAYASCSAVKR